MPCYANWMSCINLVGRRREWNPECDVKLPRTLPLWTKSKQRRLDEMAVHPNPSIRAVAAGHPKLSPISAVLMVLDEQDVNVRRALVKNPAVSTTVIEQMVFDKDAGVRAYARFRLGVEDE